jgi:lysophospholipase L1-like esterase
MVGSHPDGTQNWAAIGDSFTAGIGSGSFYSKSPADTKCARYDYTYPAIMNRFFGNGVKTFTYLACSGDTTEDILGQIEVLPPGQDLVVMTAGGNDLCLVRMTLPTRQPRLTSSSLPSSVPVSCPPLPTRKPASIRSRRPKTTSTES